jgi:hypothetical protein
MTQQNLVPRFGAKKDGGAMSALKRLGRWIYEWVVEPWIPVARRLRVLCAPPRLMSGTRKRAKAIVQTELLLDTVRVLRNDLSDDGISAGKKRALAGPGGGRAWGRITSRIFGPGESVR